MSFSRYCLSIQGMPKLLVMATSWHSSSSAVPAVTAAADVGCWLLLVKSFGERCWPTDWGGEGTCTQQKQERAKWFSPVGGWVDHKLGWS